MPDLAIFFGAGASKTEGAPLQGELFKTYFSSRAFIESNSQMDQELTNFFFEMFKIDVKKPKVSEINFPTFEEVLALADLAVIRKEAFKHFDIENRATKTARLRFIAQYLVFLVAKLLDTEIGLGKHHRNLVESLRKIKKLNDIIFISTNYDIIIDNALTEQQKDGIDLDYAVEFRNFERDDDWHRPQRERSVALFKLHGSLNWLLCSTCQELEITPKVKGVLTLISEKANTTCPQCGSVYSPIIVPPTFYKDLNNPFLSEIWNKTDVALKKVNHIIFCGYSFPDADIHIKYLLKRAQTNRDKNNLKFTVVNNFEKKDEIQIDTERIRYERFLASVDYTELSFEQFASNPAKIIS